MCALLENARRVLKVVNSQLDRVHILEDVFFADNTFKVVIDPANHVGRISPAIRNENVVHSDPVSTRCEQL